eukprot:CAMPEP_0197010750 /NCGR_PEP_ID=MMETSP1380-20130617/55707_1 /TAXON_ID=5936 /ORGANISM="Euplotes crassus, Strain CT5" /LENGTH=117 /DNA_ID=CAMNT_0042432899 /DNA_START=144 /DNA_END=497 /DNA_ORIENTATION=+
MNYLANTLGEEKAKQIEQSPEDFYNGNKFRYFQVKGYHRSVPFSIVATLAGVFAVGGYKNSNMLMRRHPFFVFGAGACIFIASHKFFERRAGYRTDDYYAHVYAKYLIMTRNLKIKG